MKNLSPYINGISGVVSAILCVFSTQLFQLKNRLHAIPCETLVFAENNQQKIEGVKAKATLALLLYSVATEPVYCNREYKKI